MITHSTYVVRRIDHHTQYLASFDCDAMMINNYDNRDAAESARRMLDNPEEFEVCEAALVIGDP